MQTMHALPEGWETLGYDDFLDERRPLMAQIIRRGFESLASTEPDLEQIDGTAEERLAWSKIETVELALRRLVETKYRAHWRERAEQQMRKALGDESWKVIERNREKHAKQYAAAQSGERSVLDYTYLSQLTQMMLASDAWELFRHLFRDKRHLEDLVKAIAPVRNDRAHFRVVPLLELRRAQVACEDLLTMIQNLEPLAP